jgi:hypothetical protein
LNNILYIIEWKLKKRKIIKVKWVRLY